LPGHTRPDILMEATPQSPRLRLGRHTDESNLITGYQPYSLSHTAMAPSSVISSPATFGARGSPADVPSADAELAAGAAAAGDRVLDPRDLEDQYEALGPVSPVSTPHRGVVIRDLLTPTANGDGVPLSYNMSPRGGVQDAKHRNDHREGLEETTAKDHNDGPAIESNGLTPRPKNAERACGELPVPGSSPGHPPRRDQF